MNTLRWVFHEDRQIAELALTGIVTAELLQDMHRRLADSALWRINWQLLIAAAGPDTSLEELTLPELYLHQNFMFAWNLRQRQIPGARTAFVCEDAHNLRIARLWETLHRAECEVQVGVFDDRDEALAWLRPAFTEELFVTEQPAAFRHTQP